MLPVPSGYPIAKVSGPVIIASLLHWGLFGTLSVQLYLYYLAFPNDRKFTKYLVYGIYIVEFVQTMFITHDVFAVYGYHFGDVEALTEIHFNWLTVPVISGLLLVSDKFSMPTEFSYCRSLKSSLYSSFLSLTSFVGAIITGVYAFQAGNVTKLNNRKTSIAVGTWCGASAMCDIVIAICMTCSLIRGSTNLRRTQMLVTKLICLTIETGSVTAAIALLSLILFAAFPRQTFYTTPALLIPKLYANAVIMPPDKHLTGYHFPVNTRHTANGRRDVSSRDTEGGIQQ
ncbi:uncharacterized protein EV420DRAFT_1695803 [Desarmillaria tabescens]|uniref:DUF6534 domain-containing protein n=1 Tax=Armillaria tabescens TaxID=1929756 RepID=A0AA39K491_ARMTA|nr:uncharacterized protein EV420DRAFT_1695803 [Desarmillaria tabescens]KAK0454259.1 hypothetical protein EV420DRAFT_1695803 [Desarmillaria tabescens]